MGKIEEQALDALKQMNDEEKPSFSRADGFSFLQKENTPREKTRDRNTIPLYGLYGDAFFNSKPSEELLKKEKHRYYTNSDQDEEIMLAEQGLCKRYGIPIPIKIENTVRNSGLEEDQHVLSVGTTVNNRRNPVIWGITQKDRCSHTWLLGPSGSGKSTLLQQFIIQDMWYHRGGLLLEPHGDLALNCLYAAPPYRLHDIVYLNVLDPVASPGLNPLAWDRSLGDDKGRDEGVAELISMIQKHFNVDDSFTRLKDLLSTSLHALSYCPGATVMEVLDFYTNEDLQKTVLSFVPEGPQKEKWESRAANVKTDDLGSLENRISNFLNNKYLRHMFGQSNPTFDLYELMNKGAMVICPVSKGGTNDDSFLKFYGSYIVSTVYKNATKREAIPENDRVLFPLTIDEFQNFMSSSQDISDMLAELRKYGLPMMLAHQYVDQLEQRIRSAMDNSCASKLCYRLGSVDAPILSKSFPGVSPQDLMSIPKYQVMAYPMIHKQQQGPFLTKVFPPLDNKSACADITAELIIENSREKYMRNRKDIEKDILDRKERMASGNKAAVMELMTKRNN